MKKRLECQSVKNDTEKNDTDEKKEKKWKKSENDYKKRSRTMLLLLYPDNEKHMQAFQTIKMCYEYIAILHDKDVMLDIKGNPIMEKGEPVLKKPHYHVIVRFKNPCWNTGFAKDIGLAPDDLTATDAHNERFVQCVNNFKNALQYLIHWNEEQKHHYDKEELLGSASMIRELENSICEDEESKEEVFETILDYIVTSNILEVQDLCSYCISKGRAYIAMLRRSSYLFCQIIRENNHRWMKDREREIDNIKADMAYNANIRLTNIIKEYKEREECPF